MTSISLPDVLLSAAQKAGCRDQARLRHTLDDATDKRQPLIEALHARGFSIAVETNGTLAAPEGLDWICVSPKAQAPVVQQSGQELKLVFPQTDVDPARFEGWDFARFLLQPMDGPDRIANTEAAIAYCLAHPRWRLGLQTHKVTGLP